MNLKLKGQSNVGSGLSDRRYMYLVEYSLRVSFYEILTAERTICANSLKR